MRPKISIIIPCRRGIRRVDSFCSLLSSCANQSLKNFELIFVSDGFDPGLQYFFHNRYSNDRRFFYLEGSGLGANGARHLGATVASGEFFYFLDDDCTLPDNNHLSRLMSVQTQMGDDCIIGGAYVDPKGANSISGYNLFVWAWVQCGRLRGKENKERTYEVVNLVGGNFLIEKRLYFCRPLNIGVPIFGDETEFFRFHRHRGTKLFFSEEVPVFHSEVFALRKFFRRAWESGKQREIFGLETPSSIREKLITLSSAIYQKKTMVLYFACHFCVLYLSVYFQKLKKFSNSVGQMGAKEQESNSY